MTMNDKELFKVDDVIVVKQRYYSDLRVITKVLGDDWLSDYEVQTYPTFSIPSVLKHNDKMRLATEDEIITLKVIDNDDMQSRHDLKASMGIAKIKNKELNWNVE